jgi:hypothetical protein
MDINKTISGEIGVLKTMIARAPSSKNATRKTLLVKHGDKPSRN